MSDSNNIELRSEEVQEILGTPPRWIIRRGIVIILLVVIVLLGGSYFFKYPDIASGRVVIDTVNPPVEVLAKTDGTIEHIFAENNRIAEAGEILAVMESSADYNDVLHLLARLDSVAKWFHSPEKISSLDFTGNYKLGEWQHYFSSFSGELKNFQNRFRNNPGGSHSINTLHEFYDNLVTRLREWENIYVLRSPVRGQVVFADFLKTGQYVKSESMLFTVTPGFENGISGRVQIPVTNAGRVESGQRVKIKLDKYPFSVFGIVAGRVTEILSEPLKTDEGLFYEAEISLPDNLTTNYGRSLTFGNGMTGTAEIITKDRRLIERLLEPLIPKTEKSF